jgi:RTX calcium-binding nonapeptide repeat (4 copies)
MIVRPGRRTAATVSVIALVAGAAMAVAPTAVAAKPKCFGEKATIVAKKGQRLIRGTKKADVIVGTNKKNVIKGKGGADRICGFGGHDKIFGQGGAFDAIDGGGGNDKLNGGKGGDDIVIGNTGNDTVNGGRGGIDFVLGLEGDDALIGGGGSFDTASFEESAAGVTVDLAAGTATGEGTDTLTGIGDIFGSPFNDVLRGDASEFGNGFYPLGGDDSVDGGGGPFDILFHPLAEGPLTIDLTAQTATGEGTDTLADIEDAYGSPGDDMLTGSDQANLLVGFEGSDSILGLAGDDHLDGDGVSDGGPLPGTDTVDGGDGTDTCLNAETLANCESTTPPSIGAGTRGTAVDLLR